ncbi:unnamed protein product [Adineta ricciae]|uniref:Uncharacterized protein n=1 Tax=Adineta ricciae TaxID=249248 RepID=A0A814YUP5_ADIRI|nr:unnamed protein product [Adineta ricciae]CAF1233253.1 unnamed protein product [Adineta ricciae]
MLRLRFHASWLPDEHNRFWTVIDSNTSNQTIRDLIEYFIEQETSFANYYQFQIPKRAKKLKYLKAFLNDYVLPPHAQISHLLRDNDEIDFRLAIDAENDWILVKPAPTSKRKRSNERPMVSLTLPPPPAPAATNDLDTALRTIAQSTTKSPAKDTFSFQFGNKRGRPIPPRPAVISVTKVNSLVPRQVLTNKR